MLSYGSFCLAVVVTVWGAERIARRLEVLRATTSRVLAGETADPFREANSVVGPVVAAGATALAFGLGALVEDGWTPGVLRGVTWFVLGIALWSFLWTYGALQLGLDRLGRERLRPDLGGVDPDAGDRDRGGEARPPAARPLTECLPGHGTERQAVVQNPPDIV